MSLKMKKTAFIGAGNMAEAMVRGLLASGSFSKKDVTLLRRRPRETLLPVLAVRSRDHLRQQGSGKKVRYSYFFRKTPGNSRGVRGGEKRRHQR